MSIESFTHKGLRELFENETTRKIGKTYHKKIKELLDILDAACNPKDLAGVSNFHQLKGARTGEHALHVNGNYCLIFKFKDGDVTDLDFEDYHGK